MDKPYQIKNIHICLTHSNDKLSLDEIEQKVKDSGIKN